MNRIYRSVWNEISRTFVAAAETVRGRGKPSSSCADSATIAASRSGAALARCRPMMLALEQRFMFDGAAAAPVADAAAAAAAAAAGAVEAHAAIAAALANVPAAVEVRAADPVKDGGKKEVVFVDTSVKDYKTLEAGIKAGVAIVEIDGAKDGLAQIAKWAESHSGYDSISILGHGAEATLHLGSNTLTETSLASAVVQTELAEIGQSLTSNGDLMLYGCDIAKGADGEAFIADLAKATGADVAASTDATGAASQGGDWTLERAVGTIDAALLPDGVAGYSGILASGTLVFSTTDSTNVGTLVSDGSSSNDIAGIRLDVFNAANAADAASGTTAGSLVYLTGSSLGLSQGGILPIDATSGSSQVGSDTPKILVIKSHDGSEFSFNSIWVGDTLGSESSIKFEGFKDGVSTGSVILTLDEANATPEYEKTFTTSTGLTASVFQNVDEVRITNQNQGDMTWGNWAAFNNIVIGDPVLPAVAPTLTATAVSPAFTENGSAVDLFSGVTAATNDSGQTFSGMALTVSNVSNGSSEILSIDSTDVALTNGSSGTLSSGGSYSVSVSSGTAMVTLTGMARDNTQMGTLVDGISYRNTSDDPGSASREVKITGITDSGSNNNSATLSLSSTVSVTPVNDAPSFTKGADQSIAEDAGAQTAAGWATGISKGGVGESSQTINFVVSNDNASLFSVQPTIDANGTLSYTAAANASGTATVTVALHDDGGTSDGGVDSSSTQTFTIAVNPVNDAPLLDAAQSPSFSVLAGSGAPSGAVGALVSSLTTGVSDVDAGALRGVAITAADTTNGTWYFSTDGGANWSAIGAVSNSSALLLAADARVYFKPASGWSGDENLSFRAWDQTSGSAGSKADASSNGGATAFSTATDTAACHVPGLPAITSAAYDAATGVLTVTGTDLVALAGTNNDIVANRLTLTGEGGATYTLSDTANVDIASATSFTLTLSATDKAAINQLLNMNGTASTGATTFNLAAAEDWAAGADAAAAIVDLTGNGVTVSNVAAPAIASASYDAASGILVVTGSSFSSLSGATNDIVANKLTLSGEGGTTYTLTDTADVDITSGTSFSLTLSATDRAAVNRIINRNGVSSTGATAFNLAAAEDWAAGAANAVVIADLAGNPVTASYVAVPAITGATYDATSGMLIVTGSGFTDRSGAGNDIIANKLTLTGEGGATYTLTNTANAEITSGTSFSLVLSATDRAAVSQILNRNGAASTGGTVFNLAAAEDWAAGADGAVVVADLAGNAVTVANVAVPTITSATYDSGSGTLVVTGTGLTVRAGANNDIVANKFTLTGEGGVTYTLTDTANVDIASATGFVLSLSAADQAQIALLINKTGTASSGGTTYNLAAAEDWAAGADAAMVIADLAGNAITAGILPRITGVSSSTADGAYKAGDTISIAVNFNQNVAVTGTPSLLLETGAIDRVVNYTSGSGTSTLIFSYTVQAGDTAADLDYLGANALALNGGSIAANDGTATDAILTLAAPGAANSLGAAKAIVIDTSAPTNTVTTAHLSADSGTSPTDFVTRTAAQTISGTLGSALASGERVEVSLDNGLNWVAATASVGANAWSLAGATLTSSNTLQVRVADSAGNLGAAISQAYVLDSAAPAAPATPVLMAVSDSGSSSVDRITQVTTPTISGTAENGAAVTLYDTDGTTVLGHATADGLGNWTITSSVLGSGTHTLTAKAADAAGNVSAVSSGLSLTIDTSAPTATIALSDTSLAAGETATVTITFSEAVSGFSNANLAVASGTLSAVTSTDGGVTWSATFTPATDVTDASNVITLNHNGVQDGAGNSNSGSVTSANYAVLTARTLSYSATTFSEATANDGSISTTATITLANETFAGADGSTLGTVSNVPAGLTAQLIKVDATHARLILTGNASAHANAQDISNLTVSFADADFAGSPAAVVAGATTTLAIDFADPAAQPVPPVNVVAAPVAVVPVAPAPAPAPSGSEVAPSSASFLAPTSELTFGAASGVLSVITTTTASAAPAASLSGSQTGGVSGSFAAAPSGTATPAAGGGASQERGVSAPTGGETRAASSAVLTQGGGFAVVVASGGSAAAGDGIVVNRGIADQSLGSGAASGFAIPADAFAASNASAAISLVARQADGRPLPGWLRFDAASGRFEGQPPPGFAGELTISVVARDAQGHEAVVRFKVKVGEKAGRAELERPGRAGLSEQLRVTGRPHPALERLARLTGWRNAA